MCILKDLGRLVVSFDVEDSFVEDSDPTMTLILENVSQSLRLNSPEVFELITQRNVLTRKVVEVKLMIIAAANISAAHNPA